MAKKKKKDEEEEASLSDAPEGESMHDEDHEGPVLMRALLIEPPKKKPKPEGPAPELELRTEVIWGPLPKEPPPKPDRVAAVLQTHVWKGKKKHPGQPSIGSMSPDRKKR